MGDETGGTPSNVQPWDRRQLYHRVARAVYRLPSAPRRQNIPEASETASRNDRTGCFHFPKIWFYYANREAGRYPKHLKKAHVDPRAPSSATFFFFLLSHHSFFHRTCFSALLLLPRINLNQNFLASALIGWKVGNSSYENSSNFHQNESANTADVFSARAKDCSVLLTEFSAHDGILFLFFFFIVICLNFVNTHRQSNYPSIK